MMAVVNRWRRPVTDAQFGLLLATPLIVAFAIALNRMGVLRPIGATAAVAASVVIAAVLYLTQ